MWDDREQLFGEARKFLIHFYLADDTMEVKEIHHANNGRDPFPTLVQRQRMPKKQVAKTFPSVEKTIGKVMIYDKRLMFLLSRREYGIFRGQ